MKRILNLAKWQLVLIARYNILTVALAMAAFYALLFLIFPVLRYDQFIGYCIFSDPGQLGFVFVGAMILFEKSENTLPAQNITPMSHAEYLWTKAIALLLPTIIGSLGIAFAGWHLDFNVVLLLLSVLSTSVIFTFLGIAGVARVKTFNQYILIIPLFLAPTALPFLNYFGLTDWKFIYFIPTQSALSLLEMSRTNDYSLLSLILHSTYLLIWVYLSFRLAKYYYSKYLLA